MNKHTRVNVYISAMRHTYYWCDEPQCWNRQVAFWNLATDNSNKGKTKGRMNNPRYRKGCWI